MHIYVITYVDLWHDIVILLVTQNTKATFAYGTSFVYVRIFGKRYACLSYDAQLTIFLHLTQKCVCCN